MKANELRIGNLVYASHYSSELGVVIVDEILGSGINGEFGYYGDYTCEYWYNDIKPIPLTEEWLVKFRFETQYPNATDNNWSNGNKYLSINSFGGKGFRLNILHNIYNGIDIKYVHQLQNLYFALTGEELTIEI